MFFVIYNLFFFEHRCRHATKPKIRCLLCKFLYNANNLTQSEIIFYINIHTQIIFTLHFLHFTARKKTSEWAQSSFK